jgi:opacity protein-like surface antigen
MKKVFLFVFIAVLCFAGISKADEGDMYIGAKTGVMLLDLDDVDDIIPLGIFFGYDITSEVSVEGELNYGVAGGDIDVADAEYDVWTLGVYGAYRYLIEDSDLYLKGKAGVLYEYEEVEDFDIDDSGMVFSVGIGGGYEINDEFAVEAEYTYISELELSEEAINYISIGVIYRF